ncbi:MAG: hypothetical protein IT371_04045 [Deltaproteobacteria bacterium]|nr:hypothetical protein [Deltaproteobacteria bacterium]
MNATSPRAALVCAVLLSALAGPARAETDDPNSKVNMVTRHAWRKLGLPLLSAPGGKTPVLGAMGPEVRRAVTEGFWGVWRALGEGSDRDTASLQMGEQGRYGNVTRWQGETGLGQLDLFQGRGASAVTGTVRRAGEHAVVTSVVVDAPRGNVRVSLLETDRPSRFLFAQTLPTLGAKQAWAAVTCLQDGAKEGKDAYTLRLGKAGNVGIRLPGRVGAFVYRKATEAAQRRAERVAATSTR